MRVCPRCSRLVEGERCPFCGVIGGASGGAAGGAVHAAAGGTGPAAARIADDLLGRTFAGRYLVTSLLGRGAQAAVYKARDQRTDAPVALKVLSPEASADHDLALHFVQAAMAWARLHHSHTAPVLDVASADGRPYVTSDVVDGRLLRADLKSSGRLPEPRLLRVAEQVCESLADAHAAGVPHLDLKPENVYLVRTPGEPDFVRVIDYGLARRSEGLPQGGPFRGTPAYAPPERIQGGPGDRRSDLYSLGVTLYELASGLPPFQADGHIELLLMHLHNKPLRLTAAWPDAVSSGFDDLVMALLAKHPDRRPPDAQSVLARIRELAAHHLADHGGPVHRTIRLPTLGGGKRARTREGPPISSPFSAPVPEFQPAAVPAPVPEPAPEPVPEPQPAAVPAPVPEPAP
ncbi:MAG: serine/threonine protein kinase, partial [Deltaproteobacteria bacterium]|nr:serine/threonine protein kinase [Deltaproteobacteria bacterium]